MRRFVAALLLALGLAAPAFAQTNVTWGLLGGNVCVYDQSPSRVCVTLGLLNSTSHTLTLTGPGNFSSLQVGGAPVATTSGALINGSCVSANSLGQLVTTGGPCTTGGGGGTVAPALAGQLAYYVSAGTTVSGATTGTGVLSALSVNTGTAGSILTNGGALGTPSSGVAANLTGLSISTGVSGLGTGVATALSVNTGTAGSILTNGGALGTPSSGVAANLTGLSISTGVSGLGTGVATALGYTAGVSGGFATYNQLTTALPNGATGAGLVYAPTGGAGAASIATDMVGFRNRVINGDDLIDQRNSGAAQTIVAGAALAYTDDRFYVYSTGANVTGQQVNRGYAALKQYQITGAASVTGVWRCQRIESYNSADLAGGSATFSVDLSDSLLTTVNWQIGYANSQDAFGTVASPTVTSISSGTFTVTPTLTRYGTGAIAIPSAATTGLQVCLSIGAQTSGTFVSSNWQLEPGSQATLFERRPYSVSLAMCQRYYWRNAPGVVFVAFGSAIVWSATLVYAPVTFPVTMRTAPTINASGTQVVAPAGSSPSTISTSYIGSMSALVSLTVTGLTAGQPAFWRTAATADYLEAIAEI